MHTAVDLLSRSEVESASIDSAGIESAGIVNFMTGFSVETTPAATAKVANFRDLLRPGTAVYVAFLPGADYKDSVTAARQLREQGFEPACLEMLGQWASVF